MSDARPPRAGKLWPGKLPGVRLGDVPVLALLAAAALVGVVMAERGEPAPVVMPRPATPPAQAVVAAAMEPPAPVPVADPPPAPPAPQRTEEPAPAEPLPAAEPAGTGSMAVTAEDMLPRLRESLAGIRCADLRVDAVDGALLVTGTVTSVDDGSRVQQLLADLSSEPTGTVAVTVAPAALCEPLLLLEPLRAANAARGAPLSVTAAGGARGLVGGQDLVLDIRAGDTAGPVQVDYFTVDGGVVHLLPNPMEPAPRLEAGTVRRLGQRDGKARFWTVGPPFGQELIVVVAGGAPLFSTPRPEAEAASAYLPELKRTLAGAEGAVAAVLFIATRAP